MKSWTEVTLSDPIVNRALCYGESLETTICRLVERHEKVMEELRKLHAIAPKKTQLPDGTIMVWHCPNELIPLTP